MERRPKYYNRNGWSLKAIEVWDETEKSLEADLINREKDILRSRRRRVEL